MTRSGRRPNALVLAAALSCAACWLSATPIVAVSLTFAVERQDARVVAAASPLYSSIVATALLIGGCVGVIALSLRHRLVAQRPDSIASTSGTPTVPPSAGSVWGVGN